MKFYLQKLQSNHAADKGFTLIEILVAAVIMSMVVTLAGTAFVALLQQNQKAKAESDRRTNLNRALDYMANEIRMANRIAATSSTMPSNATGVIRLTIPSDSTNPNREYYIRTSDSNASCNSSSSLWECPYSIYRRLIDSTGTIDNLLVDGMQAPTSGAPTCPTPTPAPTPPHQLVGSNGFYACIYSGGKKVDLYLYGKLSDEPRDPDYNKRLEVKSTVYTRAN
ncbi:prepilin-type N-terminal cleavage/methylation domain-containing protein [Sphaerospermopsis sp. LEGE 00249]|uniref:PulJ/GspJ family protein n=1 Tax=Sphaerospermopsis sp. LEGE 00249 TaxID=1380707 RepID=UPI00164E0416|nr:prepilin-type N-terminal cleavage/methylation domain-containing protein [Sphaerospermopsis sp. LEGE 00249]MBC5795523.1 prepilin-type N-terminal cleavage/methylation domain-containing protein [Sphaerospermopsis sp. LEGE 00249]